MATMMMLAFTVLEGVYLFTFLIGLGFVVITFAMGVLGGSNEGGEGAEAGGDVDVDADVDFDADVDVDMDVDGGGDFDADADMDADLDGDMDADSDAAHESHSDAAGGDSMGGFRLSPLSPTVLSLVLFCFGGTGMLLVYTGTMRTEPWLYISLVPSTASGLFLGLGLMLLFNKLFSRLEASSEVTVRLLIGTEATVITPIPVSGMGQIRTVARGTRWTSAAKSANGKPIAKYEKVVIKERRRHVCFVLPVAKKLTERNEP